MNQKMKVLNIKYFLLQVLFWGAAVVSYAYMTQILEHKGYTEVEIGILYAAKMLTGVVFQMWIGAFADKHVYTFPLKNVVAILSVISAALMTGLFVLGHNFVLMLLIFIGFGIAFITISPLIDSMALLYIKHGQNVNFAKGRAGGSISWAFLCVFAGMYCDRFGLESFPVFGIVLTVVMALFAMSMDWDAISKKEELKAVESNVKSKEKKPHSVGYLFKHCPVFVMFLIGSAVMFMGYDFGNVFLIDIFTNLGGNNTHFGIAQFVLAISEVPSAFIVIKAKKKISMEKIMVICAISMTFKNLIPTYTGHIWVVILAQAFEMLGFGLFYAGGIYLVDELIPEEDIIKATTLISVATVGFGEGIASLFCGMIHNRLGLYGLMKVGTATNAVAILIMIIMCYMKGNDFYDRKQRCRV
ncbi:MAG: MFS transporter [Lachnospiraceae bacterium]|nr:MFS transporter [Lachnospiraceae bacterium]